MADREVSIEGRRDERGGTAISEQERDWAQAALTDFNKGNYESCLHNLAKLETVRPQDFKVAHNQVVTEYYKSELKKTDHFKKSMNNFCAQAHMNIDKLDSLDDVEQCVVYYNQAVLLYHLKQYTPVFKIMEKVFKFVEAMEESLAHSVCLLHVEVHLCLGECERALKVIAYIENQFVSTGASATKMMTADKEMKPLERDHHDQPPVSLDAATDAFRLKLLQYRVRCLLHTRALKACKREIKSIITPDGLTIALMFLKGNLEYLRGNFQKALKILGSIPLSNSIAYFKEHGESPTVLFLNNMGCLYHYMGKPYLSSTYFQKALQEDKLAYNAFSHPEPGEGLSGRPLYTLGASKSPLLMYHLGISLLHSERPIQAFDCFTEAVQIYHANPRLWLRLAECCIMAHKMDNRVDFDLTTKRRELIKGVLGTGPHRKIVMNPDIYKNSKYSCEGLSYAIPVASLEFGSLCIRSALLLSPKDLSEPLFYAILTAGAYIALCLGDPVTALRYACQLLADENIPSGYKYLGRMYSGEALLALDRVTESIEQLSTDHLRDIQLDQEAPTGSKALRPWFPASSATACAVMQYNRAVAFTVQGDLERAGDLLRHVWLSKAQTCEVPVHVIPLALYIEVSLGHTDMARTIIKQNCTLFPR